MRPDRLDLFISELKLGTGRDHDPDRPGAGRIHQDRAGSRSGPIAPKALLEGTAAAARETGALVQIHTEKGALAEKAVIFFEKRGIQAAASW